MTNDMEMKFSIELCWMTYRSLNSFSSISISLYHSQVPAFNV